MFEWFPMMDDPLETRMCAAMQSKAYPPCLDSTFTATVSCFSRACLLEAESNRKMLVGFETDGEICYVKRWMVICN